MMQRKVLYNDIVGGNPSKSKNKGPIEWTRLHQKLHLDNGFHQ